MDHQSGSAGPAWEQSGEWREQRDRWLGIVRRPLKIPARLSCRDVEANRRCGNCEWCAETERWERIFQSKFADPGYYTRERIVTHQSPLSGLSR